MNRRGLSIVAVILTLLILSLFGAVATTLITTSSSVGLGEEQGLQALYIAEGGIEYVFINGTYCNYNGISGALGEGNFSVSSVFSNAVMSGGIDNSVNPVTVYLTAIPQVGFENSGFSMPGVVTIDSEYLFCTGAVSNSLTGCSRGYSGSPIISHSGRPVTQCAIRSEGTVSKNPIAGSVKRVVQATIVE